MKRMIGVFALASTVALAAGVLWAQEAKVNDAAKVTAGKTAGEQTAPPRTERAKPADTRQIRQPAPTRGMPGTPPQANPSTMQQQQLRMMQEQTTNKQRQFELYAAELKAIRKVAQDEKAKKTVAYIDKILERKEAELAAELKASEERMKQAREQMEKMTQERMQRLERQRNPELAVPEGKLPPTEKAKPETK
ncbi:MAG: hypothetical protein IH624_06225 [Phycisphaerae bacterium]|nr:hypothetical protein [Phycisphaerae bacterium]